MRLKDGFICLFSSFLIFVVIVEIVLVFNQLNNILRYSLYFFISKFIVILLEGVLINYLIVLLV